MSCAQPGHLIQSPSGTRLGLSPVEDAIGFRVFLNQAMPRQLSTPSVWAIPRGLRAGYVVACASAHRPDLPDEVVERLVASVEIELRGFDNEERRGRVVKEEVLVGL